MAIEIRLPNITGVSEKEQLLQLKSYLYQLSEQLQWAFDNIETTGGTGNGYVVNQAPRAFTGSSGGAGGSGGGINFAELKALVIKSSDIVDAYYEEVVKKLNGQYFAESDFGTFIETTTATLKATSTSLEQNYSSTQTIISGVVGRLDTADGAISGLSSALSSGLEDVEKKIPTTEDVIKATEDKFGGGLTLEGVGSALTTLTGLIYEEEDEKGIVSIGTDATIKSGKLYTTAEGVDVYGLEVGQRTFLNEIEAYYKIARLTSQGLYFFDMQKYYDPAKSDAENAVAYVSNQKLYIRHAEIINEKGSSFRMGFLKDEVDEYGDVVTRWEGGSR